MSTTMDPNTRYLLHGEIIESRFGDETVIFDHAQGIYVGLNPVGAAVWERLQEGESLEAICAYVQMSFNAVPETIEEEIAAFLQELLDNHLIEKA